MFRGNIVEILRKVKEQIRLRVECLPHLDMLVY